MSGRAGGRWPVVGLALLAAGVALVLAAWVFPYHSINHDEAVYLQQAAMLLEGRRFLTPPVPEAMRPWFFVRDGARLYPKYAPVPAAIFAVGELLGGYRLALGAVAGVTTASVAAIVTELFDRRRGIIAAALLLASPLFLVQAAVFLPYLPTAALTWGFAFAYLRADRTGSRGWAALAGLAIGIGFLARPYTAVLFAAPFIVHAAWTVWTRRPDALARQALTATLGTAGVGLALGYNAAVTGDPLLFPYAAFAPADGPGFGRRALLGHAVDYTPALALRANAEVLWLLSTRWLVGGPLGAVLALLGLGTVFGRVDRPVDHREQRRLVLAGLLLSVPVGNLLFWGNLNMLGALDRPADGLVHFLGPYYHLDLLLPAAAFGATGLLAVHRRLRTAATARTSRATARVSLAVAVLVAGVLGGVAVSAAAGPIGDNRAATEDLAAAYAPFDERSLDGALVFLPTPFGDWLNHPFQALRNDPGYDGPVVYAVDERPLAVTAAFPERTLYRYSYRGTWAPGRAEAVEPRLRAIRIVEGSSIELDARLGIPAGVESVSIRLASGDRAVYYRGDPADGALVLALVLNRSTATLDGAVTPEGSATVPTVDADAITLDVFAERTDGSGVTYRLRLPIEVEDEVRVLSPSTTACEEAYGCGADDAYVPGSLGDGVFVESELAVA